MQSFFKSIRIAWEYLTHPVKTTDQLLQEQESSKYSWIFLLFSLSLWTLVTGYQNLLVGDTSRAREVILGISYGPDIVITLLTIPMGIVALAGISFIVTKLVILLGGNAAGKDVFRIFSFTLNAGSTFFDLQYEIGATLTGHAWQLHQVPNFFYYTVFIMFAPILWSLIITVISLSHYSRLSIAKTLVAFLIGVLPLFTLLIFIVM